MEHSSKWLSDRTLIKTQLKKHMDHVRPRKNLFFPDHEESPEEKARAA
jgi:hypothetical protein